MNKIKSLVLVLAVTAGISVFATPSNYYSNNNLLVNTNSVQTQTTAKSYITVNPLELVARPNFYLNKNVKIRAKFDKFATLEHDKIRQTHVDNDHSLSDTNHIRCHAYTALAVCLKCIFQIFSYLQVSPCRFL